MKNSRSFILLLFYILICFTLSYLVYSVAQECKNCHEVQPLILTASGYQDSGLKMVGEQLAHRIAVQPFNLIASILFGCAILHTFFANKINGWAVQLRQRNIEQNKRVVDTFAVEILHFLGEVEVVFGIWVVPLLVAMGCMFNWITAVEYLSSRDYVEPLFVVVIMAIASTRPIVRLAEECLHFVAMIGKGSVQAWWLAILTLGPLSGSLITEPGAMTISALLLAKQIYRLNPSKALAYASLGLLFVNISVGGVLTSFAAPPVLMVSKVWGWDSHFMFFTFGTKALLGIILANTLYYLMFRRELVALNKRHEIVEEGRQKRRDSEEPIPFWITIVHLFFLAWVVVHSHYPAVFLGSFLLFIGFHKATLNHQDSLGLRTPVLVGCFLAGLVIHGSLQAWWITPLFSHASEELLLLLSTLLTAFNDNAEITFLVSLIPDFDAVMKYAVVAGAVTGGGLTVIANAPNPLGQSLLTRYFEGGIKPVNLFVAALPPTCIMAACFYLLRG